MTQQNRKALRRKTVVEASGEGRRSSNGGEIILRIKICFNSDYFCVFLIVSLVKSSG